MVEHYAGVARLVDHPTVGELVRDTEHQADPLRLRGADPLQVRQLPSPGGILQASGRESGFGMNLGIIEKEAKSSFR